MTAINLTKEKIPFWQGGTGNLSVNVVTAPLNQPLTPSDDDLAAIDFGVAADNAFSLGAPNNFKLSVKGGTSAKLSPLWSTSSAARREILAKYGLEKYFEKHPDMLILALALGASANVAAAGTFKYSFLSATTSLDVGGQAGYTYLRPFPADTKVQDILDEFFKHIKLPTGIDEPPKPGEVIAYEYGGYLKLGASASIGYELTGAPSFKIGQLQLSEKYSLSVVGSVGLNANIAGYFSVAASGVEYADGENPSWVRVVVHRKRSKELTLAADVNVGFNASPEKLPNSGKEFIGAALGVNAKNWLNMMDRVGQLTDLENLKGELDGLAKRFIGEWLGKAFDSLAASDFATLLQRVQKVVDSYQKLDDSAITLFDRYFNKLDFLTAKLNELAALTSWDKLKGQVDPELWKIVNQLTDGDPLSWILGQISLKDANGQPLNVPTLDEFKKRVQHALDLIQSDAHDEIRKLIKLAKENFPLDGFIKQLSTVDSISELQALVNTKLGDFVGRLIGNTIDKISADPEIGDVLKRIHDTLAAIDTFENKLFDKFKEALNQSFKFSLHADYSRSSERDALVDVMIRIRDDNNNPLSQGIALKDSACSGDFQSVLAAYQPDLVKIMGGTLSHVVRKQSSFNINIEGWHRRWNYQGFDRVIVDTEQQITTSANGGVLVNTTIDLKKDKERVRNGERAYTNFLMRFLGESSGVLEFDKTNQQYLIDTISGMAATYSLGFEDKKTDAKELQYYLSFAKEFGLDTLGATFAQLQHVLPTRPGNPNDYGNVTAEYDVRYTETGLRKLALASFDEMDVRTLMRKIVLANYIDDERLKNIAWAYWTPGIYTEWKKGQSDFVNHLSPVTFSPVKTSPFAQFPAPPKVLLRPKNPSELNLLSRLYYVEDDLVSGLAQLYKLLGEKGTKLKPADFEDALVDIGNGLEKFDGLDEGVNTVFAIFDYLILKNSTAAEARASSLKLVSEIEVDGAKRKVEKEIVAVPSLVT
jgi:hypothetical protein